MSETVERMVSRIAALERQVSRLRTMSGQVSPFEYMMIAPNLKILWTMGGYSSAGEPVNYSPDITITLGDFNVSGSPRYFYDGLAPYAELDGSNDWYGFLDDIHLSPAEYEEYTNASAWGVTMLAWCYPDTASQVGIMGKLVGASTNQSYGLMIDDNGYPMVTVRGTSTVDYSGSSFPVAGGQWHMIGATIQTASQVVVHYDGQFESYTTGVPASINNSTASFTVGRVEPYHLTNGTPWYFDGKLGIVSLHMGYLSTDFVQTFYQLTRPIYGR